ncbi:MAG TPA: DNA mismatch repair endonuclease MutL [Gemmatimonadaceae bacterium]|nr:DNA mismatch repair endonuclease MutL [Gemmatimonadaceae bacterium]
MTSRIAILPSAVADQIAAGEVVERPASVVKELVENALDAGATSIDIAVEDGGRQLVRVSDDGSGMSRDDAVLALARHATSKIRTAGDLVGVRSLGFRGEALPAICSVSQLEIETALGDGAGTIVRAAGGSVADVADTARRRGTTVGVGRLFFNAPARRKFLRGARSEWRSIVDSVTSLALVRRDVRFSLGHDGKVIFTLPGSASLRERVAALHGSATAARLVDVDDVSGTIHVAGLVERPSEVGTAGRRVHLAINGRSVRDNGIVRAAEAAYRSTIPAGVRPTLYLELTMSGGDVDVNVHPAKAEVRFRDRWKLERVVETAVRRGLGTMESGATLGRVLWPAPTPFVPPVVDVEVLRPRPAVDDGIFETGESVELNEREAPASDVPSAEIEVPPLLQLRRTYMMFERADGVVLIDQHSAHERVLFERFMRTLECGEAPSQRLLFPLTLHLAPAEADAFDAHRDLFEKIGFEVEGFGGHTLLVRAVPMPHPRFDAERCLRETIAALSGDREASAAPKHQRLAATVACKAAIKAGDLMSPGEMRALFLSLASTQLPAHDVHGRSTIVHLSWDELERRFGRR